MTADSNNLLHSVGLLAECSWEVCNKIGGIYTVLATKASQLKETFGDRLVFIGPDLGQGINGGDKSFKERKSILNRFGLNTLPFGIRVRTGRWDIPGNPAVILVDFRPVFPHLNGIYGEMWSTYGVDSLHAYGDYDESCAFAVAAAIVMEHLISHLKEDASRCIAHFNEWTTGMGLLYLQKNVPEAATVFTTHATTIGRSICGNGKPLYEYFTAYNGDQMAAELNVQSKHSLEKAAAHNADCFTTVSGVTARECEQLLGRLPDVVTPNGFEPSFLPDSEKWERLRRKGRKKLLQIASLLWDRQLSDDTFIIATSGRNEFRNKGIDLYLESMARLAEKMTSADRKAVAFVLVPAWVKAPSQDVITGMDFKGWIKPEPDYLTHRLHNEDVDSIAVGIRRLQEEMKNFGTDGNLKFVFIPSYLNCRDGIINIDYYDLLPALDLTVFASYYEPWGYTPLESIAFGVPTVTTDKAGFGDWAEAKGCDDLASHGVAVVNRTDSNFRQNTDEIADLALCYMRFPTETVEEARSAARSTSEKALWKEFIRFYHEAFNVAFKNSQNRFLKK
ncbi:MAG: glycogen/starch synthase [Muribaculaceae bacterium]|nr:glycogen/starch synthase [Muribaculaceae bacterium]